MVRACFRFFGVPEDIRDPELMALPWLNLASELGEVSLAG